MTMNKLVVLKGLPASGKSTYAKELVSKGYHRVNKDNLRAMLDGGKWSKSNEMYVKYAEVDIVKRYLKDGFNVVVDDTNFTYEDMWKKIAEEFNAEFEVKFFDVPVMECIERDSKRGIDSVGAKVIMGMYNQYLKPKNVSIDLYKENCFVFDIDGTLALMNGRSPYDYSKVITDLPNINIVTIAGILYQKGYNIIILSGREDS